MQLSTHRPCRHVDSGPGTVFNGQNKHKNVLTFTPVKQLPLSALADEDNKPTPVEPLTASLVAAGVAVKAPANAWKMAQASCLACHPHAHDSFDWPIMQACAHACHTIAVVYGKAGHSAQGER